MHTRTLLTAVCTVLVVGILFAGAATAQADDITPTFDDEDIVEIELTLLDDGEPVSDGDEIPLGVDLNIQVEAVDGEGERADITDEFNPDDPGAGDLLVESDNPDVIEIGQVFGVPLAMTADEGSANISAEFEDGEESFTDELELIVGPVEIDFYDITVRDELSVDDTQESSIEEVYTDGDRIDVTDEFELTSDDEENATVEEFGDAYAVVGQSIGPATLNATEIDGDVQELRTIEVVEPNIEVNVSDGEGGAGLTGSVMVSAESLAQEAVNVDQYTLAISYDPDALEPLAASQGELTVVENGTAVLTDDPGEETPLELSEIEFLVDSDLADEEVVDVAVTPVQSEVIEELVFLGDDEYALPSWNDGSITVADVDTGTIAGIVTDDSTGDPIEGATVDAGEFDTTTDENGEYEIEIEPGEYTVQVAADGYVTQTTDVTVETDATADGDVALSPVAFEFSATNIGGEEPVPEGGYISFNETTEETAIEEGLAFPAEGIEIDGAVGEDGSWYAGPDDVVFPDLEPIDDIFAQAEAPDGLTGTFDEDGLTAEGELQVTIELLDESFSFDVNMTSGESGALQGESVPSTGGDATLVDNEYTVPASGNEIVDGELGLPLEEPGLAWLELPLAVTSTDIGPVDFEFNATNVGGEEPVPEGGYISFDEQNETAAIEEGLAFPAEGIEINGEVGETGNWFAGPEDVVFPELEPIDGITAEPEAPNGLFGTFDVENGTLTAEGELQVTIPALEESFSFDVSMTTGVSGALEGDAALDVTGGTATIVDNEYTVASSGNDLVDGALGLPIEEPGLAWIELPLEVETTAEPAVDALTFNDQGIDEGNVTVENVSTGQESTVAITYTDGDEEIIAGLADADELSDEDVQVAIEDTGGFPGDHTAWLFDDADVPGEIGIGDDATPIAGDALASDEAFVTVEVAGNLATDTTGDGLLNDVTGDGEFTIADVQALFDNLHSPAVQANAAVFNFAGANEERVNVFDVQGLFTQLQQESAPVTN